MVEHFSCKASHERVHLVGRDPARISTAKSSKIGWLQGSQKLFNQKMPFSWISRHQSLMRRRKKRPTYAAARLRCCRDGHLGCHSAHGAGDRHVGEAVRITRPFSSVRAQCEHAFDAPAIRSPAQIQSVFGIVPTPMHPYGPETPAPPRR